MIFFNLFSKFEMFIWIYLDYHVRTQINFLFFHFTSYTIQKSRQFKPSWTKKWNECFLTKRKSQMRLFIFKEKIFQISPKNHWFTQKKLLKSSPFFIEFLSIVHSKFFPDFTFQTLQIFIPINHLSNFVICHNCKHFLK